jgi:O-antigen/teichoic acid export membrane protein
MRESRRLVVLTSAAKVYWVLVMLLIAVITARYLGPTGRGIFVATISWLAAFVTFGNLSLLQVVIYVATEKPKEQWLPGVVGALAVILTVVAVLGSIVAAVAYFVTGGRAFQHIPPSTLLIALLAFPFMLWVDTGYGILMALGKLGVMNAAQTIGLTAGMLVMFVALGPLKLGINGAVAAFALGQALIVAISLTYVLRAAGRFYVDRGAMRALLTGSAKLHLNAVGTYLFTQANVLVLSHYRSADETAWFQLGVQLVTALQIIPLAAAYVTFSMVSRLGPDGAWPQQKRLLIEVLLVVVVLAVIGYFVAPYFVPLIFGKAFTPSIGVYRILLLSAVGLTMSIVMNSQWIGRGLLLQAALITVTIGVLTVIGNYMVVPRYGMRGAAWVTVGTYLISALVNGAMALFADVHSRRNRTNVEFEATSGSQ